MPGEHRAAIERFVRYLVGAQRSGNTARLYVGVVERWLADGGMPGHVDMERLQAWLARRRLGRSVASMNLDVKALRAFYRHQASWGECAELEVLKIPRQRRAPERLPRALDDAQIGLVLGTCPLDTFVGLRDYAMLLTIYTCGLRASEVIGMRTPDLVERDLLFVVGKGGKHRYVPVSDHLCDTLEGYMHARGKLRPGKKHALWLRQDGRPLRNGRSVWEIVSKRVWRALGVQGDLSRVSRGGRPWQGHYPHELRASCATALLRNGMDLRAIADLMGHASIDTTARYLAIDVDMLRAATARHPRAKRMPGCDG